MAIARSLSPRQILGFVASLVAGWVCVATTAACTDADSPVSEAGKPRGGPDESGRSGHRTSGESQSPPSKATSNATPSPRAIGDDGSALTPSRPPSAISPAQTEPAELGTGSDGDPASVHLEGPGTEDEVPRRSTRGRKARTIEIILRSSPPGAAAAVDGVPVGATPSLWEGVADATPREFTFALPGYVVARYRFVPTQSGVVHATLEPIKTEAYARDKEPAAARDADAAEQRAQTQPATGYRVRPEDASGR